MFPIHCNNCLKKRQPNTPCHLTRCYHILCSGCLAKSSTGQKCPVCKRSSISGAIEINRNMPSNVANYFEDPQVYLKMFRSIWKFQKQQQTFYYKQFYEQQSRMEAKKEKLQGFIKMDEQLRAKIETEKKRSANLRNAISHYERHDDSSSTSLSSIEIPITTDGKTSRSTTPSTTTDNSLTERNVSPSKKMLKEFKQLFVKKT